jgi:hypothetical protein
MLLHAVLPALAQDPATPHGQDTLHLWVRESTAVAVHPAGVITDLAAEVRAPVLRLGGAVFNDTFVGAGGRLAVTPVHAEGALRLDTQLVDVLPVYGEAFYAAYWESPWGLVPVASVGGTTAADLRPLYEADRDFGARAWGFLVSPTLQARVGPVVAFSNPTFTVLHVQRTDALEPWVFEPYRGLVVGYDDRILEHVSAVLWEPLDGDERPLLRLGAVVRGRSSSATPDTSLTAGLLAQWRPGRSELAPVAVVLVTPYLSDHDFAGPVPFAALQLTFTGVVDLRGAPAPDLPLSPGPRRP